MGKKIGGKIGHSYGWMHLFKLCTSNLVQRSGSIWFVRCRRLGAFNIRGMGYDGIMAGWWNFFSSNLSFMFGLLGSLVDVLTLDGPGGATIGSSVFRGMPHFGRVIEIFSSILAKSHKPIFIYVFSYLGYPYKTVVHYQFEWWHNHIVVSIRALIDYISMILDKHLICSDVKLVASQFLLVLLVPSHKWIRKIHLL